MATNKVAQPNLEVSMRIKELREELGCSQRVMARLIEVKLTRYQKWEQRGRIPAEFLPEFARITNSSIEFILTGTVDVDFSLEFPDRAEQQCRAGDPS
jgi:transcriptional regulator with XRE-family HTH domain